jgi:hypothetical protein
LKIEHYFPLPVHTLVPSDDDFGIVESLVRRHVSVIHVPEDWISILKNRRKQPIKLCHMQVFHFCAFVSLNQREDDDNRIGTDDGLL